MFEPLDQWLVEDQAANCTMNAMKYRAVARPVLISSWRKEKR